MNKRIEALAEQAVTETQRHMIMEYKTFESKLYEKFAELIIKESCKYLSDCNCEFEAEQLEEFWNDDA